MAEAKDKKEKGGIQSLERAAAILDVVAASSNAVTLAEISAQTGLHTSTAFHLIKTLVGLGFLNQDAETRRYRIGSRLFTLAAGAQDDNMLLNLGMPVLERLSAETGEGAHLAVRSRHEIVLVARTAASGMLQMSERAGIARPAHATAIGKILLAHMPQKDRIELVDALTLVAFTPNTITDKKKLLAELETVRGQGLAHDRCEFDAEVRCIAMPVYDFSGRCAAAIGISGPIWRMNDETISNGILRLETAAAALSNALGYSAAAVAE